MISVNREYSTSPEPSDPPLKSFGFCASICRSASKLKAAIEEEKKIKSMRPEKRKRKARKED